MILTKILRYLRQVLLIHCVTWIQNRCLSFDRYRWHRWSLGLQITSVFLSWFYLFTDCRLFLWLFHHFFNFRCLQNLYWFRQLNRLTRIILWLQLPLRQTTISQDLLLLWSRLILFLLLSASSLSLTPLLEIRWLIQLVTPNLLIDAKLVVLWFHTYTADWATFLCYGFLLNAWCFSRLYCSFSLNFFRNFLWSNFSYFFVFNPLRVINYFS